MSSLAPAAEIPPAKIGDLLFAVDTPAAIIDLDTLEANLRVALAIVNDASKANGGKRLKIRPHQKAFKSGDIAALCQTIAGNQFAGVCCQKVVEAEYAVESGIKDVLVSNQVVGASKLARVAALVKKGTSKISILVDCKEHVTMLAEALVAAGISPAAGHKLHVLVEIDVGQARCGVGSVAEAVELAHFIHCEKANQDAGLVLEGVQTYQGAAQHVRTVSDRAEIVASVAKTASEARKAFVEAGLPCNILTGGGSGTFPLDAKLGVLDEVQPGSFLLGDADYSRNQQFSEGSKEQSWLSPFKPSLFLLSTIMARREGARVVIDSGLKAQSTDSGNPVVVCTAEEYTGASGLKRVEMGDGGEGYFDSSVGGLVVKGVSDEHSTLIPRPLGTGVAIPAEHVTLPPLGTKLLLMPGHCDPFVNHYDWLVGVRKHGSEVKVEAVMKVKARSPGV
jgi:3-hydroxy-D-aspartate aldolase